MNKLIITNGDLAAGLLRAAGLGADVLPWRDVLHDGPVPETGKASADDLETLSAIRAAFLADAFGQPREDVARGFRERDRKLLGHLTYQEVVLWFEHDLYDQLQLLQLLAFFHHERDQQALKLVQADDYLGMQAPDDIGRFEALEASVTTEQAALASILFQAFRKPAPTDLAGFLSEDLSPFPHMRQALLRLFEELPSADDGLSRTQRQTLLLIEREELPPRRLFGAVQTSEEAMFLGDWSFWRCLEELVFNKTPLIQGLPARFHAATADDERQRYFDATLTLTDAGLAVLSGQADHAEINTIDRWLGGTHVTNGSLWRWDGAAMALVSPS